MILTSRQDIVVFRPNKSFVARTNDGEMSFPFMTAADFLVAENEYGASAKGKSCAYRF